MGVIQLITLRLSGKVFCKLQIIRILRYNHSTAAGRDDLIAVKGIDTDITHGTRVFSGIGTRCIVSA